MELEEKYEKEKGYSAKENYTEGLWNGNYTDEYVEWLEDLVEKSNDIHNVSECMESECNSKRYWHFIYCEHHARRKKLI